MQWWLHLPLLQAGGLISHIFHPPLRCSGPDGGQGAGGHALWRQEDRARLRKREDSCAWGRCCLGSLLRSAAVTCGGRVAWILKKLRMLPHCHIATNSRIYHLNQAACPSPATGADRRLLPAAAWHGEQPAQLVSSLLHNGSACSASPPLQAGLGLRLCCVGHEN